MHPELFTIPGIRFAVPGYGAMLVIGYVAAIWWASRRARRVKADPEVILSLALIGLFGNLIGSRTFYVIHYWQKEFAHQPLQAFNLQVGGFELYGGVLTAFTVGILYLMIRRLSVRLYLDLAMPSVLLGMGIGRIGCFLYGCCFGAVCPAGLPWAVQFPVGSPPQVRHWQNRLVSLPAELVMFDLAGKAAPVPPQIYNFSDEDVQLLRRRLDRARSALDDARKAGSTDDTEKARKRLAKLESSLVPLLEHLDKFGLTTGDLKQLAANVNYKSRPVHPAQIYSAVGPVLLALLTSAYFYRRKRHGTVVVLGLGLYAAERFLEEMVRADNPVDTFGLTVSQGLSLGIIAVAVVLWVILKCMPMRNTSSA